MPVLWPVLCVVLAIGFPAPTSAKLGSFGTSSINRELREPKAPPPAEEKEEKDAKCPAPEKCDECRCTESPTTMPRTDSPTMMCPMCTMSPTPAIVTCMPTMPSSNTCRFIQIIQPTANYLNLREVQAFSNSMDANFAFINGPATMISGGYVGPGTAALFLASFDPSTVASYCNDESLSTLCSSTNAPGSYLRIEYPNTIQEITDVVLWNRADANQNVLNGATLQLFSDSNFFSACSEAVLLTPSNFPGLFNSPDYKAVVSITPATAPAPSPSPTTNTCRFVKIIVPMGYVNLREVQAFGDTSYNMGPQNAAKALNYGPTAIANQIVPVSNGAALSLETFPGMGCNGGDCAASNCGDNELLTVCGSTNVPGSYLQIEYPNTIQAITDVVLWNRIDANQASLDGATVQLFSDSGFFSACSDAVLLSSGNFPGLFSSPDYKAVVSIPPATAPAPAPAPGPNTCRFLRIEVSTNYLNLREVQVFGSVADATDALNDGPTAVASQIAGTSATLSTTPFAGPCNTVPGSCVAAYCNDNQLLTVCASQAPTYLQIEYPVNGPTITHVVVWNRIDANVAFLDGATLELFSDASGTTSCSSAVTIASGTYPTLFSGEGKATIPTGL